LWNVVVNVVLSFHYEAIGCVNLLAVFSSEVFRLSVLIRYIQVGIVMCVCVCVINHFCTFRTARYKVFFADNDQNVQEIAL